MGLDVLVPIPGMPLVRGALTAGARRSSADPALARTGLVSFRAECCRAVELER